MALPKLKSVIDESETLLATIRGGVLVHLQDGLLPSHLTGPLESSRQLKSLAVKSDDEEFASAADVLTAWLRLLAGETAPISHTRARSVLDQIAAVEAALVNVGDEAEAVPVDVAGFIDESFNELELRKRRPVSAPALPSQEQDDEKDGDDPEVDGELAEVFREEAEGLIQSIRSNLETLASAPADRDALWEIKRNAHTFKGAAGIVGLKRASELAHRIEGLLERLSADQTCSSTGIVPLLLDATDCLSLLSDFQEAEEAETRFDKLCKSFDDFPSTGAMTAPPEKAVRDNGVPSKPTAPDNSKDRPSKSRIVRVSLDRLDDLVGYLRDVMASRPKFAAELENLGAQLQESRANYRRLQTAATKFDAFSDSATADEAEQQGFRQSAYELTEATRDAAVINAELTDVKQNLDDLTKRHHSLIEEMRQRLLRLRKVEFGTVATRLQRTVGVTCEDEGKLAELVIENPKVEVDTQLIDLLIEPLMHLLKNAVVHGIEPSEIRRMIGKSETGRIKVRIENIGPELLLKVSDDGRGIAFQPLIDKAVASGLLDPSQKEQLTRRRLHDLLFVPGLTTAERLTLNAGRGVGMSIVREAVVSAGGTIKVETSPQHGSTFTITVPCVVETKPDLTPTVIHTRFDQSDSRGTIVIVDDSPSVRMATARTFEYAGWQTLTARNGLEALDRLRDLSEPPAVIVSDIEMPLMNGYELIGELQRDDVLSDVPVVVVSSRSGAGEREKALAAGAEAYFTKPCDENELVALIGRLAVDREGVLVF